MTAREKAYTVKPERYSLMLLLLALCPHAHAQELPDAPSMVMESDATRGTFVVALSRSPRGHNRLLALAGAVGFAIAADHYDISETEKGLKAGVAIEDNTWLVGSKPSAGRLYARDMLVIGISASPSIVAYIYRRAEFFYGGLTGPVVMGFKHINGGNQWKALLAGHTPTGSELGP